MFHFREAAGESGKDGTRESERVSERVETVEAG